MTLVHYVGVPKTTRIVRDIEVLGPSCFIRCRKLITVVFEEGSKLICIGSAAFAGCSVLSSICILASVDVLSDWCFSECTSCPN
jgi:hypothetical protein